jgi:lipopolysaccharide/colanic/teichoic acid biosynthesis glycosyltransferase
VAAAPSAVRGLSIDLDMEYVLNAACALALLLFFAPMMIVTAILVKMHDGGPVLFGHRRIGKGGHTFPCFKFRSMAVDADRRLLHLLETNPDARREWERDFKLQHDPRITPLGHFLRKSSLDELPQLLNVLRGEMSLVGPRPIVQAEVPRYGRRIAEYCSVRSGITGLWQISGRSDVDYRRRVAIDVTYVRAKSFLLDVKILVLTIPAVLLRRGAR